MIKKIIIYFYIDNNVAIWISHSVDIKDFLMFNHLLSVYNNKYKNHKKTIKIFTKS